MFTTRTILKGISILILGVFFLAVGLSVSMGMTMRADGMMSDCPFMQDNSAMCPMSLATHIAKWQQLSTAKPAEILIALMVLVFFVCTIFKASRKIRAPLLFAYLRKRNNAHLRIFGPLFAAFSRGILHSRLFA